MHRKWGGEPRACGPWLEGLEHRVVLSTFHINTTLDTVAVNLQNGKDASGHISLRSAIMAANAKPNADTIVVPAGTYMLTIPGAGEDNDATGDLDIKGNLTRAGQAPGDRSGCLGSGTISLNRGPRLVQEKENSNVLHEIGVESKSRDSNLLRMLILMLAFASGPAASGQESVIDTRNPFGVLRTITIDQNPLDLSNPFFQSIGTNGRSCVSCHVASSAWTITPDEIRDRFRDTEGLDPIFRTVDGSNSPNADVSSLRARRKAYSMLLTKGLIRIGLPIPAGAEFTLVAVDDPYGYASASELSLFRRPVPATNLRFLTAVMWDGRESFAPMGTSPILSPRHPTRMPRRCSTISSTRPMTRP